MSSRPRPTLKLLDKYYPAVKPLRLYLDEILDATTVLVTAGAADSLEYTALLTTSLVGLNAVQETPRRFQYAPPMSDMREVLDRAIEKLLRAERKNARQNVITAGYSLQQDTRKGLANFHVNTNITALQAPEWETLLQRIGTDAMLHLLTDTSVFVALPNDCFCQLVGEPMMYIRLDNLQLFAAEKFPPKRGSKRALPFSEHGLLGPTKRLKVNSKGFSAALPGNKTHELPPAKVLLCRGRLFYGRLVRHKKQIAIGLPPKHILNRLNGSHLNPKVAPELYVDPDPRKQMDNARNLAKYVFPRQYGLASPFKSQTSPRGSLNLPDFSDREKEIKALGPCKTPKRLRDVIPMLEKLLWRHGKSRYKLLRDHACPSKVKELRKEDVDSSGILELISEHTPSAPRTQQQCADVSLDSEGNTILPAGLSQAALHARAKPRFVEYACSHFEIYRYAVLASKAVIPPAFWGSEANFKLVLSHVKDFISCRRFESLSLHHIVQGFSTSTCDWLMPPGAGALQLRVPVSDALKRRELLEDFLFWYFDSFLLPLLKTTFYVTESSALRNHILYFRHDDWEFLCAPLIERLTGSTFEKLSPVHANQILNQRKLGFSFIRLLPKETGVRPIANLRRKAHNGQSINQILQAAFKILTYERDNRPQLVGASIFSTNELYIGLKEFKARLLRNNMGKLPKLYFVKVDVQACFDTILQTKLLDILRELLSEDAYVIQRYGKMASEAGNVKRMYVQKAYPDDDHPHFLKVAADLAKVLHSTIFVDQVKYSRSEKANILALLEEHITENLVKIGGEYYRQTIGIPQGSVLSSILCAFFYGDLEKRFGKFTEDPNSMLLRQTDDYMFVSSSLAKAKDFLSMMNRGHEDYGCFISKEKTLTNFDFDEQLNSTPHERGFPWCGYVIDTQDLSVSVEYSRYYGTDLKNTLTVHRGRNPGAAFRFKMLQLAKARSHIIFNDTNLSTLHIVYLNMYQNCLLSALKMDCYIRDWGLDTKKHAPFLRDTVQQMISYASTSIRNRARTQFARSHGGRSDTQRGAVTWLGMHAFHAALSCKAARYSPLLKWLRSVLKQPLNRRYARRFKNVTAEGLATIAPIYTRL